MAKNHDNIAPAVYVAEEIRDSLAKQGSGKLRDEVRPPDALSRHEMMSDTISVLGLNVEQIAALARFFEASTGMRADKVLEYRAPHSFRDVLGVGSLLATPKSRNIASALQRYWAAKDRGVEREAYLDLLELGYPPALGESAEFVEKVLSERQQKRELRTRA